ncbi:MAG: hypothetical protein PVH77_04595 [Phycisphaerales bacterium]|jgi:hypothetical protein
MKRTNTKAIISIIVVVLLIGALQAYLFLTPVVELGPDGPAGFIFDPNTRASRVFDSVSDCAERQKGLYGYIEAYREKHGKLPDSINTLINDDSNRMHFTNCPLGYSYEIHPENYGKPNAVFISETRNKHSNTLSLWIRGIKPRVQTMGDGTIQMFKDGKIATVNAKTN